MIEIRLIQPDEWNNAKQVVYRVAHEIFKDQRLLEDSIAYYESRHELADMDNIQRSYFENGGTFLVMFQDGEMICTGAIRRLEVATCELKRLWLLTGYHGQGLGYRMLQALLSFAKNAGYKRVWLQTDPQAQSRAVDFYKQIGFYEIPRYTNQTDDICMEMML